MSRFVPSGRRMRWLLTGAIALACLAVGAMLAWHRLEPAAPASDAVATVFSLTLPGQDGQPVDLARFRGRPLVLNFWATWCPPCIEEMPALSRLQPQLTRADIHLLGIAVDSASNVAQFARKQPVSYPLLIAGASGLELLKLLGDEAGALPFTVVIGADGKILQRIVGQADVDRLGHSLLAATAPHSASLSKQIAN